MQNVNKGWAVLDELPHEQGPQNKVLIAPKSKFFYCSGCISCAFAILGSRMCRGVLFEQNEA